MTFTPCESIPERSGGDSGRHHVTTPLFAQRQWIITPESRKRLYKPGYLLTVCHAAKRQVCPVKAQRSLAAVHNSTH